MAILNVNPTRMELQRLRRRYSVAARGHKLLKDKQDELVRRFIILIRRNEKLRIEVERELISSFKDFTMASALAVPNFLELALSLPKQRVYVDVEVNNIMSVNIPEMEFIKQNVIDLGDEKQSSSIYPYGFTHTNAELDRAVSRLDKILEQLLELAEVEKTAQLMADEIEVTRRRVNALEYRTIPDLEETIKFIRMRLEESERETITRLMKTKDLIANN
ncbi:MAG: V-type ATP synthase subunit D [Tissierellia bacterium]|jgi:V/A-type H+-transporting ATPase subunit D|nr:V-type ATP synthase subunit D [Tissierellia bacterium]